MDLEITSKSNGGQNAPAPLIPVGKPFGFIAAFIFSIATVLTGFLWWRFGETVYANAIINAVLACF